METPPLRPSASDATSQWRDIFVGPRGRMVTGLLILEALVAIYALVITTIMPAVRCELGGTSVYGFAFTAWSLAAVISIPIAGHAADRYGPRRPLLLSMGVFVVGLAMAGLAANVAMFIVGIFIQGLAGGSFYALSLGTVAKSFPESVRAKVMALLASMWILPGLVGPFLGAMIAEHVGWRYTFVVPLPVLLICALLVLPALRGIRPEIDAATLPIRWSVQLALGAGIALYGLTLVSLWTVPITGLGALIGWPASRHILPRGTLRARPGLPAAAAAMFLLSFSFIAADSFIPLMLTDLRGYSLAAAGLVITISTVAWASGSYWQSKAADRMALGTLETTGVSFLICGIVGTGIAGLTAAPAWIAFPAWGLAGLGMGIAFPTLPLSVMTVAEEGKEAGQLSSTLLTDTVGMAFGAGLGGACIAIATRGAANLASDVTASCAEAVQRAGIGTPGLRAGIAGAFGLALIGAIVLLRVAPRIPPGRGGEPH